MRREDFEIMAPAGSHEALVSALDAGADAVYFGVDKLNMRAGSAANFSLSDLEQIVKLAHGKGVKCYLTANTVIYDQEAGEMRLVIESAMHAGIDAVIATDMATIEFAHGIGMPLHLSTQVNITNCMAVEYHSRHADVMVLARELTLSQIKHISDYIASNDIRGPSGKLVRLEAFIHGALCMAISGKCYLSLHEHNRSANRGLCYQTCRKGYIVTERESGYQLEIDNEYIMSPKDLCTIGFIDKIAEAGITIMKIEGRARPGEYVKTVTRCYDEALHSIIDGTYGEEKIEGWRKRLSAVFNRGFWDGYYMGKRLGEWSHRYGSSATRTKRYLGKVTNYYTKKRVAEITLENGDLQPGDRIYIAGPTTGVTEMVAEEVRVGMEPVEKAHKGEVCSIPSELFLRRSDKVYHIVETGRGEG